MPKFSEFKSLIQFRFSTSSLKMRVIPSLSCYKRYWPNEFIKAVLMDSENKRMLVPSVGCSRARKRYFRCIILHSN